MGAMARSLADELNEMTDQDTQQLGQQIFKAQRAHDGLMDTATVHVSINNKLTGGKGVDIPLVMDSGCMKDLISKDSVLERPLSIISATNLGGI